jgi:hypothetical protein
MNKPVFLGVAILDLSKLVMAEFYYDVMQPMYGVDRIKLLMTDTDSLCFALNPLGASVDSDFAAIKDDYLDTSNYRKDHPLYSQKNNKVVGMMKNEEPLQAITEFVGLAPKCYSYSREAPNKKGELEKRVLKGVSKAAVKSIMFHHYKRCLLDHTALYVQQHNLRSFKHNVVTTQASKLALRPFDTKRYILGDGITSLAHGHCKIPK